MLKRISTINNASIRRLNSVSSGILISLIILALTVAPSLAAYGQSQQAETQDYLMIEVLLSMQGAVIGGGLGIFAMGQTYETFINDCRQTDENGQITGDQTSCLASQEIFSLCAGYAIGLPIGATLGLMLSELLFNVKGNMLYALFGSMLGELAGVPQCSLIGFLRELGFSLSFNPERDSDLSLLLNPFMLSALGAVIGYNFDWLVSGGFTGSNTKINLPLFEYRF